MEKERECGTERKKAKRMREREQAILCVLTQVSGGGPCYYRTDLISTSTRATKILRSATPLYTLPIYSRLYTFYQLVPT